MCTSVHILDKIVEDPLRRTPAILQKGVETGDQISHLRRWNRWPNIRFTSIKHLKVLILICVFSSIPNWTHTWISIVIYCITTVLLFIILHVSLMIKILFDLIYGFAVYWTAFKSTVFHQISIKFCEHSVHLQNFYEIQHAVHPRLR